MDQVEIEQELDTQVAHFTNQRYKPVDHEARIDKLVGCHNH